LARNVCNVIGGRGSGRDRRPCPRKSLVSGTYLTLVCKCSPLEPTPFPLPLLSQYPRRSTGFICFVALCTTLQTTVVPRFVLPPSSHTRVWSWHLCWPQCVAHDVTCAPFECFSC
jgi:hypothetical protein